MNWKNHKSVAARCDGFTLIEVLVVVAIVGILASIMIPGISSVRETAQKSKSVAQMRQIVSATLLYAGDHDGALPDRTDLQRAWQLNGSVGVSDAGYVSSLQIDPYLPCMDPVWFDPLTSQAMDREGRIAKTPASARWVARVRYNARLTHDWSFAGLSLPVRLDSIVRPSEALLYYNGNSSGWAGYHDGQGTVGFADGSVRRVDDGASSDKMQISKRYIAIKAGEAFPGFLD